jgi:hypothetical protein
MGEKVQSLQEDLLLTAVCSQKKVHTFISMSGPQMGAWGDQAGAAW